MKSERHPRHRIFKACVAMGFALGVILLWQTVSTYNYVYGNLLTQAAQRDTEQKRSALQRAIRPAMGFSLDATSVQSVLQETIDEWKDQVAWIRILNSEGVVVAAVGSAP